MSKSDIKVHVDNDVVTVSVEKEDKRGEDKEEQGVRCDKSASVEAGTCGAIDFMGPQTLLSTTPSFGHSADAVPCWPL